MPRVNIRCCCDGEKIYGSLEIPDDAIKNRGYDVTVMKNGKLESESIVLKTFYEHPRPSDFCIYSDDRPIEFWRNFISFEENTDE